MRLSRLEEASEYEFREWMEKSNLNLTPYQKEKLRDSEMLRHSPYYLYKKPKAESVSFLWRFTLILFPIYLLIIIVLNPIKWIFTGKWGYGQTFLDKFHYKWVRKLGL